MKTHTRTVTTIEVDDIEVELEFTPNNEPTVVQPTPDTLVVGYLVHDDDCQNPMKDFDGEGELFTNNEGVITDDSRAMGYLGLTDTCSGCYSPVYDLEHDGIGERVLQKIEEIIRENNFLAAWMVSKVMENEDTFENLVEDIALDMCDYMHPTYDWTSVEDREMIALLPDYDTLAKTAWQELYNEGKIGKYLAVPVRYQDNNHGPGTTSIHTTTLDDANAVWVPGENEIANMTFPEGASYLEKLTVAEKYAEGVLKNYANWCNGDCWGVVVEIFKLEGDKYEQVECDACWGYIGDDAEGTLKEEMNSAAKFIFKETV